MLFQPVVESVQHGYHLYLRRYPHKVYTVQHAFWRNFSYELMRFERISLPREVLVNVCAQRSSCSADTPPSVSTLSCTLALLRNALTYQQNLACLSPLVMPMLLKSLQSGTQGQRAPNGCLPYPGRSTYLHNHTRMHRPRALRSFAAICPV